MKKIVGTIAAIALAASSAFAGVGIGSWGRALWAPVQGDKNGVSTWEGISWFGNDSRVGISIHGESENIGFNIDLNGDGGTISGGDTAYFWASPFSWLTVKIGKVQDDTARGNAGFGAQDWNRNYSAANFNDDLTFVRFGNGNGGQAKGAIVKITPVDGLWFIAAMDVQDEKEAEKTYLDNAQYGAGYTIDGIGSIRAQYIGADVYKDNVFQYNKKLINAAFDLTAVDNLLVTVGAFIPVDDKKATTIAAYARMNLDAITLHVGEKAVIDGSTFNNEAAVGLGVDLGNGLGVEADVRHETKDNGSLSFIGAINKGLAGGSIGVGFQGKVSNLSGDAAFSWCVPVRITAGF